MLQKFKKIKDKQFFFSLLSELTECNPQSIQNNWFKKLFYSVPKPYTDIANETIDKFIAYEKELQEITESLKTKHFGI